MGPFLARVPAALLFLVALIGLKLRISRGNEDYPLSVQGRIMKVGGPEADLWSLIAYT